MNAPDFPRALCAIFLAASAAISANALAQGSHSTHSAPPLQQDAAAYALLESGLRLASSGHSDEALAGFDKVIALYEDSFKDEKDKLYSARSKTEMLGYLLQAVNAGESAKVVSASWARAYYLKGYVLQDLHRIAEAKAALLRAVELAPENSQYLGELGSIYQIERNWPRALDVFQSAASASDYSPPKLKNAELARAWRGMGYVLVELGQLDEAEKWYQKCLALDNNDARALAELRYVQERRAKQE